MKLAAKAHGTVAQLVTTRGHQGGELALRRALGQYHRLLTEFGAAIGVCEKHNFVEISHEGHPK